MFINSTATPILNEHQQVIAILAGKPKSETKGSWQTLHDEVYNAMTLAQKEVSLSEKQLSHRRGDYAALSTGGSFGHGQQVGLHLALL